MGQETVGSLVKRLHKKDVTSGIGIAGATASLCILLFNGGHIAFFGTRWLDGPLSLAVAGCFIASVRASLNAANSRSAIVSELERRAS
ncbi:hypothetical protein GCM10007148_00040 [Parvularcula lutaonensis]|nr:hypothetical protein GCM10007148_00040 [Parvularcula lutaonensis]